MKYILLFLLFFIPYQTKAYTESVVSIDDLNIYKIQEKIDKGYLNYEQLTNIYLDRINEYNSQYNAVISVSATAVEEAKKLDDEYESGQKRSDLHGIPILIKDNIDVYGMPTTNGAKGLLDAYPKDDASIVKKLKEAGAIIIGKANMDEFAFNATYSKSSFGYVYNAYDTSYSAYGSSGGSAVSVAANLAVAAIGTDTNSSIRVPAAANNVVGLRPTHQIIDADGIIKYDADKDVAGPITKYIEDNAIILEIIDNTDDEYNIITKDLSNIKIGVFESIYERSPDFIKELFTNQVEILKSLGAEVEFINTISLDYQFNVTSTCYDFETHMSDNQTYIKTISDLIINGGYIKPLGSLINNYCDIDFRQTTMYSYYLKYIEDSKEIINSKFEKLDIDVVIYPTIQDELLKISELGNRENKFYSYAIAPITGYPSLNIPIGFYNELPYGMEILGLYNSEETLYQIGYQLQEINNFYKTPDIASSLYDNYDQVNELLKVYESKNNDKSYEKINNKVVDFIDDYNNINNKNDNAKILIEEYEETEEKIYKTKIYINISSYIFITTILILIILTIIILNCYKKKIINIIN